MTTKFTAENYKEKFVEAIEKEGFHASSPQEEIEVCDTYCSPRKLANGTLKYAHSKSETTNVTLNWHSRAILNPLYFNPENNEVTYMTVSPTMGLFVEPGLVSTIWLSAPLPRFIHEMKWPFEEATEKPIRRTRLYRKMRSRLKL